MQICLLPEEGWNSLNDQVGGRVYPGLSAAVYETVVGAAQFLSHKRSLAYVKGQSFVLKPFLPHFYKEAYNVQTTTETDPSELLKWVESLKKDTACAVFFEDHPITGEVFAWKEVDALLNDRKIYSVRVSHNLHRFEKHEIHPYSMRVCHFDADWAVAFIGEKIKAPPLSVHTLNWQNKIWPAKQFATLPVNDATLVKNFEAQLPSGFHPWLKTQNRIYDRAVIYHDFASGDFLRDELLKRLGSDGQTDVQIETLNLCRWGGGRLLEEWWEPKPSNEQLSRSLVIEARLLKNPSLLAMLAEIGPRGAVQV